MRARVLAAQVRHEHAEGGEVSGGNRHDHGANREFARDVHCMQRTGAAVCHEREVARIEAAFRRDGAHGVGHRCIGDRQHAACRGRHAQPQRSGDVRLDGASRRVEVQLHAPTEKALHREATEYEMRVGHGGLFAARAITRRARTCAGAFRSHAQAAGFVDPRNAAAAGADFLDVDDRNADDQTFVVAADEIVRRKVRAAVLQHAGLRRRAAHVEADQIARM